MRGNRLAALLERLKELKEEEQYLFPGTVARFIVKSETVPGQIEISLIWRSTAMPDEHARQQGLEKFREALADVLDWNTAQYSNGQVLMHT